MYKSIFLLLMLAIYGEGDPKNIFVSPLDIPLTLSANFGELRSGHFHSGVDFKTNGVAGKRVYSVADGYIYRIGVSPGGFGNAIYIRHPNGYSTVYGHLDRFTPEIEKFVTDYQYRNRSFSVNISPDRERFRVTKGELIGFSGNSGSSFGPHLHFEVRLSKNENPINPLIFFDLEDNIKPVIKKLTVYPIGNSSLVNGNPGKSTFDLIGSQGKYRISSNKVIPVWGEIGFGVTTWDFLNNSWNKCGVRTIEVRVDDEIKYKHSVDQFSFANTRYINSHIDYEEYILSNTYIHKTFLSPNNILSIYDTVQNGGRIELKDLAPHNIKILVSDYAGNLSELVFTAQKTEPQTLPHIEEKKYSRLMPYNQANEFSHHDIKVSFPAGAFYDTLKFEYSRIPGKPGLVADIHYIHNRSVPVHKFFNLSIKPVIADSMLFSKAGIVSLNKEEINFVGGIYSDGFITARIRDLGIYSVAIDTVPPEIKPVNFRPGLNITGRSELRFEINDRFSGISEFEGFIDGNWALFEWDPKKNLLIYKFNKGALEKSTNHNLVLIVKDAMGNTTHYKSEFYW